MLLNVLVDHVLHRHTILETLSWNGSGLPFNDEWRQLFWKHILSMTNIDIDTSVSLITQTNPGSPNSLLSKAVEEFTSRWNAVILKHLVDIGGWTPSQYRVGVQPLAPTLSYPLVVARLITVSCSYSSNWHVSCISPEHLNYIISKAKQNWKLTKSQCLKNSCCMFEFKF